MERFSAQENIKRFKELLRKNDLAPSQRGTIERLLAQEEARLASLDQKKQDQES